jgi:hypothetical protein
MIAFPFNLCVTKHIAAEHAKTSRPADSEKSTAAKAPGAAISGRPYTWLPQESAVREVK